MLNRHLGLVDLDRRVAQEGEIGARAVRAIAVRRTAGAAADRSDRRHHGLAVAVDRLHVEDGRCRCKGRPACARARPAKRRRTSPAGRRRQVRLRMPTAAGCCAFTTVPSGRMQRAMRSMPALSSRLRVQRVQHVDQPDQWQDVPLPAAGRHVQRRHELRIAAREVEFEQPSLTVKVNATRIG